MVWVYDRAGSLLVTMLMHASPVASAVIIDPPLTAGGLLTYSLMKTAVLWRVGAAVAVVQRRGA